MTKQPQIDFAATLEVINQAGYGYSSEWLGDFDDRENMLAKFTVYTGTAKRKVGEWYAPRPALAAAKACAALNIQVRTIVEMPDPAEAVE